MCLARRNLLLGHKCFLFVEYMSLPLFYLFFCLSPHFLLIWIESASVHSHPLASAPLTHDSHQPPIAVASSGFERAISHGYSKHFPVAPLRSSRQLFFSCFVFFFQENCISKGLCCQLAIKKAVLLKIRMWILPLNK